MIHCVCRSCCDCDSKVTNLATGWDTNLGGREFDRSIVAHFASQLLKKGGDIYSNKRAHYRMLAQMHKSKEVLSANKETEFSLDGLVYDIDFKGIRNRLPLLRLFFAMSYRSYQVRLLVKSSRLSTRTSSLALPQGSRLSSRLPMSPRLRSTMWSLLAAPLVFRSFRYSSSI